ncbi:hypothetical protein HOY80DRAFT_897225, partial [Tuber brumale]
LWGKALTHAVYMRNRVPHAALDGCSSVEVLTSETLDLSHLQPFGSHVHIFIP